MTRIQEPLTLPKHPELLHKINEMSIRIKLHHIAYKSKEVISSLSSHPQPEWVELAELLDECRKAINEQREDPRRY